MLNYVVDPQVLQSFVPRGTEIDFFKGQTFLSMVGFRFLRTRLFGLTIPLHTDFEEVNLRFYVRRKGPDGWRRGVVFVREIVPRRAIAFVARTVYGEPYLALPMRHTIELSESRIRVEYAWRRAGRWESLHALGTGHPCEIKKDSEEEFITEHYWRPLKNPFSRRDALRKSPISPRKNTETCGARLSDFEFCRGL